MCRVKTVAGPVQCVFDLGQRGLRVIAVALCIGLVARFSTGDETVSGPAPTRDNCPCPPAWQHVGPAANRVTRLPGLAEEFQEEHYSGYVVLKGTQKHIFYYLVTSQSDPANDPLVVWVNGGPGDSSFVGFAQENGPYTLTLEFEDSDELELMPSNVSLTRNPNSWNRVANMLYIDNPAGAGMSYSLDEADYNTTDTQQRIDLEQTVRQWLQMYPFFQNHDVFYSGESYGGQYVTMLASQTLRQNDAGDEPYINLKGYMIGNPVTADALDNVDLFQIYAYLSLIPLELNQKIVESNCNVGKTTGPSYAENPLSANHQVFYRNVSRCTALFDEVKEITKNLYGYNVIYDPFYAQGTFEVLLYNQMKESLLEQGIDFEEPYFGADSNEARTDDRGLTWWLNQRDVRAAIHAHQPETGAGIFYVSTSRLTYNYDISNIIPMHEENIDNGLRVLVYSGDHDAILGVPWPGSQVWTSLLGQKLGLRPGGTWRDWYKPDPRNFGDQTAGYVTQYEGLTYMTVRGAGHQVPIYRPAEAFIMFTNFLTDTIYDTTVPTVGLLEIPEPI